MDFKNIRVLILEGYARQSLPLAKAFTKLGCEVSALCNSKIDVCYNSRYVKNKILGVCDREKEDKTTEQVRTLLKTGHYDVVVPTVDFSAGILAKNKVEFEKYAKIASNNWDVYDIAADKLKTMKVCMENGIPCPLTLDNVNSVDDVVTSGIKYPIVMKPKIGYGAIGFHKFETEKEFRDFLSDKDIRFDDYLVQEYIPQTDLQYECAMFMDNENNAKTSLVFSKNRWYPVTGGSSTLNMTVERPDIIADCERLLKIINWRGAADIDLIQDPRDGKAKIMEINPRVSGSVKICFISGVNQARQMLELLYNESVTEYKDYVIGNRLRCSQIDLLWFLKSKNRFRANPSWFSMKNTKDHTFSWDDPLPWFAFSVNGLKNLKKESEKRK